MTQPIDTNALRSAAENQRENLRYQGHGEPLTGLAIQAAGELDRLRAENERLGRGLKDMAGEWKIMRADLREERHAHNKTQFDLAEAEANINLKAEFIEATINQLAQRDQELEEARKERSLIVAIVRDVVNSFQDEDGYELAGQVRIRLKQIERGEHKEKSDAS